MALTQQSNALYIFTKTMRDLLIFIRDKFVELFELIKVKTFEFLNPSPSNASSHALHLEFPEEEEEEEEEEDSSLASTTSDLSLGEINEEVNIPEPCNSPPRKRLRFIQVI